jgi:hypothetical protein
LSESSANEAVTDTTAAEEAEATAINKKFEDSTQLGDQAFLYSSWSAWALNPKRKTIAPIVRIVLGDLVSGNVVFDRSVVLTGVADLLNELSHTFLNEVARASEITGYSFDLPSEPELILKDLREAQERISVTLDLLNKSDLLKRIDPEANSGEARSKTNP